MTRSCTECARTCSGASSDLPFWLRLPLARATALASASRMSRRHRPCDKERGDAYLIRSASCALSDRFHEAAAIARPRRSAENLSAGSQSASARRQAEGVRALRPAG